MKVTGKCFCGAVRYRATLSEKDVSICYCGDCTRAVGSALTTWAHLPADDFEFVEGTPTRFESSPGQLKRRLGAQQQHGLPAGRRPSAPAHHLRAIP